MELAGALGTAGHELAVGRTDHEGAGDVEERDAGVALEFGPELAGAEKKVHVARVFPVGLTVDAGKSMRRAVVVGRRESVEGQDAEAVFGKPCGGSAAHCAEAEDDDVRRH